MKVENKYDTQHLYRDVMGNYPTGVTIVTTVDEQGEPAGLTVNSFASVSLDPLLVLWSIDHSSSSLDIFKNAISFAINILSGAQQELCQTFSSRNGDRFKNNDWFLSENNLPIIKETFAVLECDTYQLVEAGDHTIIIGKVKNINKSDNNPMLYHRRQMGEIPESFYK